MYSRPHIERIHGLVLRQKGCSPTGRTWRTWRPPSSSLTGFSDVESLAFLAGGALRVTSSEHTMVGSSTDSSSATGTEDTAHARRLPRERLPPSTMRALQLALAGPPQLQRLPCCSLAGRVRAWASTGPLAAGTLGGLAVLVLCTSCGAPLWTQIGWAGLFVWIIVGVNICESAQQMAFAVVGMLQASPDLLQPSDALDEPLNDEADSPRWATAEPQRELSQFVFMERLLRSRVSSPVAKSVKRVVKLAVTQCSVFVLLIEACFLGMGMYFRSMLRQPDEDGDSQSTMWMLCSIFGAAVSTPVCGAIGCGFLLFFKIPCAVAVDRIHQQTRRIQGMTAATADWNAVMGAVQQSHETTVRLGALLRPPLTSFHLVGLLAGCWWFVCAIAPRTNVPPTHPLSVYFLPEFFFVAIIMVCVGAVWPLYYPAAMTQACDELLSTITRLRTVEVEGHPTAARAASAAAAARPEHRGAVRAGLMRQKAFALASPNNLIRIEGICRYASELNRGQGLGFCLRRVLITNAFVTTTLLKLLCSMAFACESSSYLYAVCCMLQCFAHSSPSVWLLGGP